MRRAAMLLVLVFVTAASAGILPMVLRYPKYLQGQATSTTGTPIAVLVGLQSDTLTSFYYAPRILDSGITTGRQYMWIDNTSDSSAYWYTWQNDNFSWVRRSKFTITNAAETTRIWTVAKSVLSTAPALESIRFRVRRVGTTANVESLRTSGQMNVLNMTTTGNGGWLTGHIRNAMGGLLLADHVVLAYGHDTIVGSCISENNHVAEGYDSTDAGYFYMAVRAGQIDSLRVCARTEYRTTVAPYTQMPRPWTVTAGGTTSVDSGTLTIIQNVSRTPQYPLSTEPVVVSARVFRAGDSIRFDTLRYGVNDTSLPMRVTHDSIRISDSTYFYHIPMADTDATVSYRILAWNVPGTPTASATLSYKIPLNHSIYQVQYSTKDTSPDRGKYVHTAGIVTGIVTQAKTYIGTATGGPWSGVCLYRRGTITDTLRVGDSLDVVGTVVDFNLLTELDSVRRVIHGGSSAFDTTRVSIAASKLEDYEGVLMRLDTIRMLQGVGGNFAVGTYQLTNYAGTDTTLLYVTSGSQFVGTPVPAGWCRLVCNGSQYNALRELDPRVPGDIAELPADVSVTAIIAPGDSVHIGDSVTPAAVIQNMGALNSATNFIVTMRIGGIYNVQQSVTSLAPGAADTITFSPWTAAAGRYLVTAFSSVAGDPDPANDTARRTIVVGTASGTPWTCMASQMPTLPSNRQLKDGGWLAYDTSTSRIYAAKGYKTSDFYSYNPGKDSWRQLAGMPLGVENKMVSKGSAACTDNAGTLYATKGNNTTSFYKYAAAKDSWYKLADVPLGTFNKKVKGGTSAAYVAQGAAGYIYLLKGYKNEFYQYRPAVDSWFRLTDAPQGSNIKWDNGSFLVYDGDRTIYAHKAKYHELYAYDVVKDSWVGPARKAMPIIGRMGKTRKAKDGSCATWLGDAFYAFKGANSQEFWRYMPAGDSWTEMETIPAIGISGAKKRVKGGAGLATVGGVIYGTKGNKCSEIWMYVPTSYAVEPATVGRDGVTAQDMPLVGDGRMVVLSNPLRAGFATVRLNGRWPTGPVKVEVLDVAGRVIKSTTGAGQPVLTLDLRGLRPGAYMLRLESSGMATTQKLVVR